MLFKDVLVDETLKSQLINLVKENRVSHAQLFLGGAGTHKFALAVAFAQYLCCEHPSDTDSCGECPSCKKFAKLSHPDLHLIFPNCNTQEVKKDSESKLHIRAFTDFVMQNNYHLDYAKWLDILGGANKQLTINIRDCASIINQNSIRSYEGGYKIYILWRVDKLYYDAAPKLLKTLEEPENKTLFILLADSADTILQTILSRTQLVKIPAMRPETISRELVANYGASQEAADDIANISEGNFIKALELLNDNGEVHEMLTLFEFILTSAIANKMGDRQKMQFPELRAKIETVAKTDREKQVMFFSYMTRMFRNLLMLNTNNAAIIKATAEERAFAEFFKKYVTLRNITPILDECNKAIFHLIRNGNSILIFTDFYLKLSAIL
ncbi:MAG: hypothetical protein J5862_00340 [Bacteroidales bacterium]|nr:hypothetical protein [Bacteroidales bacterium]